MSFKTSTPKLPSGIESLIIHAEATLSSEARAHLVTLLGWVLGSLESPAEVFRATLGAIPKDINENPHAVLKKLRAACDTKAMQLTAYKNCYLAAHLSARRAAGEVLSQLLKAMRELFAVEPLEAGLIHDLILAEHQFFAKRVYELTEANRIEVIGLCCLLLRVDGTTHVRETEVLRLIAASLQSGQVSPAALMTAMGRKPAEIFSAIEDAAKPWAYLQLLRIGCADGAFRPKEAQFVEGLKVDMSLKEEIKTLIHTAIMLELGVQVAS